jgi:hypothetical protein
MLSTRIGLFSRIMEETDCCNETQPFRAGTTLIASIELLNNKSQY